jgi:hypothetical protein
LTFVPANLLGMRRSVMRADGMEVLRTDVVTNSTSYGDITGLSFPVVAGGMYLFDFRFVFQSANVNTGIALAVNGPATPTTLVYHSINPISLVAVNSRSARAYDGPTASSAVDIVDVDCPAIMWGFIRPSVNGTVIGRVASETGGVNVTIKAGSVLLYRRVS